MVHTKGKNKAMRKKLVAVRVVRRSSSSGGSQLGRVDIRDASVAKAAAEVPETSKFCTLERNHRFMAARQTEKRLGEDKHCWEKTCIAEYHAKQKLVRSQKEWLEARVKWGECMLEKHTMRKKWEEKGVWEYACFAKGGDQDYVYSAFEADGHTINKASIAWAKWHKTAKRMGKIHDPNNNLSVQI